VILNFSLVIDRLATWLRNEQVPFVLGGGLALQAFGYARFTADVDLVVPLRFQRRVIEYMEAEGYETLYCSEGYSNHLHVRSDFGRVDFIWVNESTAEQLLKSARPMVIQSSTLPVPRAEHLIAMKLQAIRNDPDRRLRDLADIRHLVRIQGVDQNEVRDYFERYGLLEDYDDVKL
jgi:hypothetical protein